MFASELCGAYFREGLFLEGGCNQSYPPYPAQKRGDIEGEERGWGWRRGACDDPSLISPIYDHHAPIGQLIDFITFCLKQGFLTFKREARTLCEKIQKVNFVPFIVGVDCEQSLILAIPAKNTRARKDGLPRGDAPRGRAPKIRVSTGCPHIMFVLNSNE